MTFFFNVYVNKLFDIAACMCSQRVACSVSLVLVDLYTFAQVCFLYYFLPLRIRIDFRLCQVWSLDNGPFTSELNCRFSNFSVLPVLTVLTVEFFQMLFSAGSVQYIVYFLAFPSILEKKKCQGAGNLNFQI